MTDWKAKLIASQSKLGRRSKIEEWRAINPKRIKDFDALLGDFIAVRKDNGASSCSYRNLTRVIRDEFALVLTENTVIDWLRRHYPDDADFLR